MLSEITLDTRKAPPSYLKQVGTGIGQGLRGSTTGLVEGIGSLLKHPLQTADAKWQALRERPVQEVSDWVTRSVVAIVFFKVVSRISVVGDPLPQDSGPMMPELTLADADDLAKIAQEASTAALTASGEVDALTKISKQLQSLLNMKGGLALKNPEFARRLLETRGMEAAKAWVETGGSIAVKNLETLEKYLEKAANADVWYHTNPTGKLVGRVNDALKVIGAMQTVLTNQIKAAAEIAQAADNKSQVFSRMAEVATEASKQIAGKAGQAIGQAPMPSIPNTAPVMPQVGQALAENLVALKPQEQESESGKEEEEVESVDDSGSPVNVNLWPRS